jgi:O-antigen/teichoic acid export membrane protein
LFGLNILVNIATQFIIAVSGFLLVPIYISNLGEAGFGIVALLMLIQSLFSVVDSGLNSSLNRTAAMYISGSLTHQYFVNYLSVIGLLLILVVVLLLTISSYYSQFIISTWLTSISVDQETVMKYFTIISMIISARLVESAVKSALTGIDKQIPQNFIITLYILIRSLVAYFLVAELGATVVQLLYWLFFSSVLVDMVLLSYLLKVSKFKFKFSFHFILGLKGEAKFALGIMLTTITVLLFTQFDKLYVSKYYDLGQFGYYMSAFMMVNAVQLVAGPISQAFFPKYTASLYGGDVESVERYFRLGTQAVVTILGSCVIVLFTCNDELAWLWLGTGPATVVVSKLVKILVVGVFLNCLLWIPLQCHIARGITKFNTITYLLSGFVFLLLLFIMKPVDDIFLVSKIWVFTNITAFVFGILFIFGKDVPVRRSIWFFNDILIPFGTVFIIVTGFYMMLVRLYEDLFYNFFSLLALGVFTFIVLILANKQLLLYLRAELKEIFGI